MSDLFSGMFANVDVYDAAWVVVTVIGFLYAVAITVGRVVDLYYFYHSGWNGSGLKQSWDNVRMGLKALMVQSFLLFAGYLGATAPTPAGGYTDRQITYRVWAIGVAFVITIILWLSERTRRAIRRDDQRKAAKE